jgi:hypothetical protein
VNRPLTVTDLLAWIVLMALLGSAFGAGFFAGYTLAARLAA